MIRSFSFLAFVLVRAAVGILLLGGSGTGFSLLPSSSSPLESGVALADSALETNDARPLQPASNAPDRKPRYLFREEVHKTIIELWFLSNKVKGSNDEGVKDRKEFDRAVVDVCEHEVGNLFPRSFSHLFGTSEHPERAIAFKLSAMEIYNEAVRDLLSMDDTPLRLLGYPELKGDSRDVIK